MSNRTLIEINHDFSHEINSIGFLNALSCYLRSARRENAKDLEPFGVKVLGIRHHSGKFFVESEPEGFPVTVYPPRDGR